MQRCHYTRPRAHAARRWVLAVALAPLLLAGCSVGPSPIGRQPAPITTGSIAAPVDLRGELPPTLAYSDAAGIGQAARAAFQQADGTPYAWENPRTGSSGTLQVATDANASGDCHPFTTLVASTAGVHHYLGDLCLEGNEDAFVHIEDHPARNPS